MHAIARLPVLIEPVPVQDVIASGIIITEKGEHLIRVVIFDRRVGIDGIAERIVVGRFTLSNEAFADAVETALRSMEQNMALLVR